MNSRRSVLAVAVAALLAPPRARAADPAASAPIQTLNGALIAAMKAGKATPFARRYTALLPMVEQAFDLPAVLRASVGPRWTSIATPEQQQLLDVFRKFTVASYTANFSEYNNERIEIVPEIRAIGGDQVVGTQIVAGGEPTRIDYRMHQGGDGWRAVDVLLDGSISQVVVYRSDWRSLLATGGGALVASLQRKVADLSGGAIS